MRLGRRKEEQKSMWLSYDQLPRSQGHVLYERLQKLLRKEEFDTFPEKLCAPFYAEKPGRKSIPPGRSFRMLLIGEEKNSRASTLSAASAGAATTPCLCRSSSSSAPPNPCPTIPPCAVSASACLPLEIHHELFVFVLEILEQANLLRYCSHEIDAHKKMHLIWIAAKNNAVFFAYRVAMPRHRFK